MSKYYSSHKLFSHNAFLNIVMSGRGTGKSFEGKNLIIKNFLKDGSQSVYIRRTKVELDSVKKTYWNDIRNFYPNLEFEVKGDIGYIDGSEVVHFIPLSTSPNLKSASYPNVTLMLFDEYILTQTSFNRYLKNEMNLLFDLIETVFRSREKHKILLMANSVSYVNPLFSFFNIEPIHGERFSKYNDGLVCIEIFESPKFLEDKMKTKFAQLIKNTAYGKYAIGNETLEDTSDFIKKRTEGKYIFISAFKSNGFEVGVWLNQDTSEFFVDDKIDKSNPNKFTILIHDNEPGYLQLSEYRNSTWRVKHVKRAYNNANLFYSNQENKKFIQNNVIRFL